MSNIIEKLLGKTGAQISINAEDGNTAGSVVVTSQGTKAKVGYVGVKPEYRGQQYGMALLGAAEEWAKNQGLEEVVGKLEPVPGSERALLKALEKRGYTINRKTGNVRKKI